MARFDRPDGKSACANIWMRSEVDCNPLRFTCAHPASFFEAYIFLKLAGQVAVSTLEPD
jgi:hypothetical protein